MINLRVFGYLLSQYDRFAHAAIVVLSLVLLPSMLFSQCPANIGFESGTFDNWFCVAGNIDSAGVIHVSPCAPIPGRHTLFKNNYPQAKDRFGNFPVNCPNGSGYSIQLGNEQTGAQAEGINYTLTVPADKNSYSIVYNYAVVFQNPSHDDYQQPRFTAKVFDVAANKYLVCSSFDFAASSSLPGFKAAKISAGTTDVYYKPWSSVTITLVGYAGKTLNIEFMTNDCTKGGHFGYAYLDINEDCSSLIGGNVICVGQDITTLVAPYGFEEYHWYNADFSTLLGTGNTLKLDPTPKANTQLALEVYPFPGSGCIDTLYTTMTYSPVPFVFKVTDPIGVCAPGTVDLTASAVTTGSSSELKFAYYEDIDQLNYVPTPKTIDSNGVYFIKATNEEGCADIKPVSSTVGVLPVISVKDPPPYYYPDKADLTDKTLITGNITGLTFTYWKDAAATITLPEPNAVAINGIYYIEASTAGNCSVIDPVKVTIQIPPPPNAFSPNGDGVHDLWEIPALTTYPLCEVKVFDRYGRLLFQSVGYNTPWDGRYNGKALPLGTYYYVIKPSDKIATISGSVTIIY